MRMTFVACLSLFYGASALATPWYVATNGDDSAGTGSSTNPFQTIARAMAAIADGDSILIGPGTYVGPDNRGLTLYDRGVSLIGLSGSAMTRIDCELQTFFLRRPTEPTSIEVTVEGLTVSGAIGQFIVLPQCTVELRSSVFLGGSHSAYFSTSGITAIS